jgi:hypothetical protein
MTASIEGTKVIDRPVSDVFRFFADGHVQNHPRWDPDIELHQVGDGPLAVGTMIRRRNSRSGTPVDGPMEIRGRVTFEPAGAGSTSLTMRLEFPSMDEGADTSMIANRMKRSLENIKHLIETQAS